MGMPTNTTGYCGLKYISTCWDEPRVLYVGDGSLESTPEIVPLCANNLGYKLKNE